MLEPLKFSTRPLRFLALGIVSLSMVTLGTGIVTNNDSLLFVAIGWVCLLFALLPILVRRAIDPFEPIVLLSISVLFGCSLRSVVLAVLAPSDPMVIFLTDGVPLRELALYSLPVPLGLAALSIGYMSMSGRLRLERLSIMRRERWSERRLIIIALACAVMAVLATIYLSRTTSVDFSDFSTISQKRAVKLDEGADVYASLGYMRWLANLSSFGFLAALTFWLSRRRSSSASAHALYQLSFLLFLFLLLAVGLVWPLVSSSRSAILKILFSALVLMFYLRAWEGMRAKRRLILWGSGVVLLSVFVLVSVGIWRHYSQTGETRPATLPYALVQNTAGSGNFLPLERTAFIIKKMADSNKEMFFGASYLRTLLAPIPRSVWPYKPEIGLGTYVRRDLYERPTTTNGFPPGLIGEAYINFGMVGVIIIPFLAGLFLRGFYNSFKHILPTNKNAALLYSVLLWPLGFQVADLDFALVAMNCGIAATSALIIIYAVAHK